MESKTNAMRILDRHKIAYRSYSYDASRALSGIEVATALGQNPKQVFKTLVTVGKSHQHYVFMIPVAEELDLKKAAAAAGEKSVEMVKSKELLGDRLCSRRLFAARDEKAVSDICRRNRRGLCDDHFQRRQNRFSD